MGRALGKDVRGDAVDKILRHQAGGEDPTPGFHALGKLDLARAELDREQRLYALGHPVRLMLIWWPVPGGVLTLALRRDGLKVTHAGATDDPSFQTWLIQTWLAALRRADARRALAGASAGAELPGAADHHDRAVRGRRLDRRAGARSRRDAAGADRPEHHRREQAGRLRHARRRLCGARRARRLHAVRQFDRRCAEPAFSPGAV